VVIIPTISFFQRERPQDRSLVFLPRARYPQAYKGAAHEKNRTFAGDPLVGEKADIGNSA